MRFFNNIELCRAENTFKCYHKRWGWDTSLLSFTLGWDPCTPYGRIWLGKFRKDFAYFTGLLFTLAINILLAREILSNAILIFRILSSSTCLYYTMRLHQHHADKWKIAQRFHPHKRNHVYFLTILGLRPDFIYYVF